MMGPGRQPVSSRTSRGRSFFRGLTLFDQAHGQLPRPRVGDEAVPPHHQDLPLWLLVHDLVVVDTVDRPSVDLRVRGRTGTTRPGRWPPTGPDARSFPPAAHRALPGEHRRAGLQDWWFPETTATFQAAVPPATWFRMGCLSFSSRTRPAVRTWLAATGGAFLLSRLTIDSLPLPSRRA